jgi:hypothetical protein
MTVAVASPNLLDYMAGQCTAGVAKVVSWVGHSWGDAKDWAAAASKAGFTVNKNPTLGSVVVWGAGQGGSEAAGHVAEVVGFQAGGLPIVQEQNWGLNNAGLGNPDIRGLTLAEASAAQYIQPPSGTLLPTPVDSSSVPKPDVAHYGVTDMTTGGAAGPPIQTPPTSSSGGIPIPDWLGQSLELGIPGVSGGPGGIVDALLHGPEMQAALAIWNVFAAGVGYMVHQIAHAAATLLGTTATDIGIAAENNAVPIGVAAVVLVVLFA